MIAAHVTRTTEQMVAKELSTFVTDSLDDILQFTYEKARMTVWSVVYKIVEKILFDLLRLEAKNEILNKRLANCFNTGDAADKIGGKSFSINASMAQIAVFI